MDVDDVTIAVIVILNRYVNKRQIDDVTHRGLDSPETIYIAETDHKQPINVCQELCDGNLILD